MISKVKEQIQIRKVIVTFLVVVLICLLSSCESRVVPSKNQDNESKRVTLYECLACELSGELVKKCDVADIDCSNLHKGYLMARYTGNSEKAKIRIIIPNGDTYTYDLPSSNEYRAIPLSGGNGKYVVKVFEYAFENKYSQEMEFSTDVSLDNEFSPFLYPNQFVDYCDTSKAVLLGRNLSSESENDLSYIQKVYDYVTDNISYDYEKAKSVQSGYLPNIDDVYDAKKGICFDYAALMSAMLRSQGIPTKLVVGYAADVYHAWISVYLDEIGWVDNLIQFNGSQWSMMDPTYAATSDKKTFAEFISKDSNYTAKYYY